MEVFIFTGMFSFYTEPEVVEITGINLPKEEFSEALADRLSDKFMASEKQFCETVLNTPLFYFHLCQL